MSKQLRELQARKATLVKDARALTDIAAAEQRDMNDEEVAAFEALKAKIEATSAAIDREAALIAEEAQMNHPSQLTTASVITVVDNAAADPKHGFKSVGDFLKTVRQAQNPGASIDERLLIHHLATGHVDEVCVSWQGLQHLGIDQATRGACEWTSQNQPIGLR